MLCSFQPAKLCKPKQNADTSFCSGQLESNKVAEKRRGGLVNTCTHPEIQYISWSVLLPLQISCSHFSVADATQGKFGGWHKSSSGGFSFTDIFSIDLFCLRVMAILLMTLTSTGWLMEASPWALENVDVARVSSSLLKLTIWILLHLGLREK